jgi:hypothetical protein
MDFAHLKLKLIPLRVPVVRKELLLPGSYEMAIDELIHFSPSVNTKWDDGNIGVGALDGTWKVWKFSK